MLERKEPSVTIFRGDDTGGQLGKTIIINFHCGDTVNMEGVVVTFILGGFYEKEFRDVHDGDRLEIFMTHEQTAMLPLGVSFGKLYGTDASGKIRTFSNRIPIRVTNHVCEAYGSAEESGIDVTISNAITWDSIFGKPETFPPSEHRHQKSDIDNLENDLQTLSDGVESAIEAAEAAKTEVEKKYDKTGGAITGDVSISGSLSLTGSAPKITANQKDFSFPTESGKLARAEDYYTTAEVDDKITTFVAHYLTGKDSAGHFVPFATRAALDYAKQHHTEEDPQFFYAGEPFTPTKNDYCVVLADETVGGKTARYSFVGEWPTGSWQYQYTINDTAFSEAQWDAINSGVTSAWMASTLSALQSEVERAQAAEAQLTTKAENAQSAANAAQSAANAASDKANELDTTKADKSALTTHVNNKENPHAVTAEQTGAVPFVVDSSGNKTAVTIGSRKSGSTVGEYSFAAGFDVSASGHGSYAEGQETNASGDLSHTEGFVTAAEGFASHAEGGKARTLSGHTYAYAWNGDNSRSEDNPYTSHGEGTFNVNPAGGLGGFWIGEQTLEAILEDAVKDKADRASLAPEYSATSAYSVGAFVYYGGNIYQCKTAIADGGEAWNAEHWELRKLDDFFTESNSLLTGRVNTLIDAKVGDVNAVLAAALDGTEVA